MKRIAMAVLCAFMLLTLSSAPVWCDEAKADDRAAYSKANDSAGPPRIAEPKALSRSVFCVPPFYTEEIITTAEGVKKITTFLLFIRVESHEPRSRK
ncbi:MAG: hypothetical protein GXP25_25310 [Planctomycetes bacterium]|nr:hypothetical protein [Planctomycetota bacterium]